MKKTALTLLLLLGTVFALSAQDIETSDESVKENTPTWRFAIQGGGSYRLAGIPSDASEIEKSHIKKLKWGLAYGADITGFFSENLGAGIKFHNAHFGHEMPVTAQINGRTKSGSLEDQINIFFVGPILSTRSLNRTKTNAFILSWGLGYIGYNDAAKVVDSYRLKGGSLGFLAEVGYDIGLAPHLSLGFALTYMSGTLSSYKITNQAGQTQEVKLEKGEREGLANLSLNIGLRYNL